MAKSVSINDLGSETEAEICWNWLEHLDVSAAGAPMLENNFNCVHNHQLNQLHLTMHRTIGLSGYQANGLRD